MLIYELRTEEGRRRLHLQNTISVDEAPWDLAFDAAGRLWVISPNKEQPLQVFHVRNSEVSVKRVGNFHDCICARKTGHSCEVALTWAARGHVVEGSQRLSVQSELRQMKADRPRHLLVLITHLL